jgi:hypothetical protein
VHFDDEVWSGEAASQSGSNPTEASIEVAIEGEFVEFLAPERRR